MKQINVCRSIVLLCTALLLCSCGNRNAQNDYLNLQHKGGKALSINVLQFDTLRLDASSTSLDGVWLMREGGNKIFMIDKYSTGANVYRLDGSVDTVLIKEGRGPNEVVGPAWIAGFDNSTGDLTWIDGNCFISIFTPALTTIKKSYTTSWSNLLDTTFYGAKLTDLYNHPDPEEPYMYEYNYVVNRIQYLNNQLVIPVITEHISFNGYYTKCQADRFWKESYIFIAFDPYDIGSTKTIFGHYPSVYQNGKNIPIFSTYDFFIKGRSIYVTFAADPNIYVLDKKGKPQFAFGVSDEAIKGKYPETKTFEDYDDKFSEQRKEYGYYGRLFNNEDYTFRTIYTDNKEWKLQIYKEFDLIGDIPTGSSQAEIFGYGSDGSYYAYVKNDLDNEEFVLVKFKLPEVSL